MCLVGADPELVHGGAVVLERRPGGEVVAGGPVGGDDEPMGGLESRVDGERLLGEHVGPVERPLGEEQLACPGGDRGEAAPPLLEGHGAAVR